MSPLVSNGLYGRNSVQTAGIPGFQILNSKNNAHFLAKDRDTNVENLVWARRAHTRFFCTLACLSRLCRREDSV